MAKIGKWLVAMFLLIIFASPVFSGWAVFEVKNMPKIPDNFAYQLQESVKLKCAYVRKGTNYCFACQTGTVITPDKFYRACLDISKGGGTWYGPSVSASTTNTLKSSYLYDMTAATAVQNDTYIRFIPECFTDPQDIVYNVLFKTYQRTYAR
jgi:hypothetical protein